MHHFVGADSSCISWGHAQYGELGYGPNGQKFVLSLLLLDSVFCFTLLTLLYLYFEVTFSSHFIAMFVTLLCSILLDRSSAVPKKVDILEGMHVIT